MSRPCANIVMCLALWLSGCVGFYGDLGASPDGDADGDGDWDAVGDAPVVVDPELDSDGDSIRDRDEGNGEADTDLDGWPDTLDLDSDNDELPDSDEAGDDDPSTPPVDTDGDGIPDFQDRDSDDDGISDFDETTLTGTDHLRADTDGDGASDLVEYLAGTDPTDIDDDPTTHGDFVYLAPFDGSPFPEFDTLEFSTEIQKADVYFLVDTTGSMTSSMEQLQLSLSSDIIPGVRAAIPDVWFGVGQFQDYPHGGYGGTSDRAYEHLQDITDSIDDAQEAVNSLTIGSGGDGPESTVPALHALATGCGDGTGDAAIEDDLAGSCADLRLIGYAHFRFGAVPIVVLITDAPFHNGTIETNDYLGDIPGVTPPLYVDTVAALNEIHARVIGINPTWGSPTWTSRPDLEAIAPDTGTVGPSGPLVYDISHEGTGLGDQVIEAIADVGTSIPIDITAAAVDDDGDDVDAVEAFIERIEPSESDGCTAGLLTQDTDSDGHDDTFIDVGPGSTACFDVIPRENTTVPPGEETQVYTATIQVWGEQVTLLDERRVYFLVPR